MKLTSKFAFIAFFSVALPLKAQVTVSDIPAISTEHYGIYDSGSEQSLGDELWVNSSLSKDDFSADADDYYLTAKSYNLLKRVLLTSAQSPYAFENDAAFARAKMRLLYNLGLQDDVGRIMEKYAAKNKFSADLKKLRINSSLLSLYYKRSCAIGENDDSGDIYYDRLRVFCQIYRKQTAAAALSVQAMREQKLKGEFFYELAEADIEDAAPIDAEKLSYIEPLYFGLYYLNRHAFNPPIGKKEKLWSLYAVFGHKNAAVKARIEAGEILLKKGAVTADDFKKIVMSAKDNNQTTIDYRKVVTATKPLKQAEMISKALLRAKNNGTFKAYSILYAPIIKDIAPEAAIISYADEIIPALLYGGYYNEASAWEKIAERESEVNPQARKAANLYAPIIKVLTGISHYGSSSHALKRFHEQEKQTRGIKKADYALSVMLAIYDAYGIDYDSKVYLADNYSPDKKLVSPMTQKAVQAFKQEQLGDAVIFGLRALRDDKTAATPLLKFLRSNGMRAETDDIAVSLLLESI